MRLAQICCLIEMLCGKIILVVDQPDVLVYIVAEPDIRNGPIKKAQSVIALSEISR